MTTPKRLAVLLSGGGTTLQNLLDRTADGRLRAEVVLVVSNRHDAFGLERARKAGVRTSSCIPSPISRHIVPCWSRARRADSATLRRRRVSAERT